MVGNYVWGVVWWLFARYLVVLDLFGVDDESNLLFQCLGRDALVKLRNGQVTAPTLNTPFLLGGAGPFPRSAAPWPSRKGVLSVGGVGWPAAAPRPSPPNRGKGVAPQPANQRYPHSTHPFAETLCRGVRIFRRIGTFLNPRKTRR